MFEKDLRSQQKKLWELEIVTHIYTRSFTDMPDCKYILIYK